MSRPFTIVAVLLMAVVSFGLYQLSYAVQRLEDELAELNRAIVQDRQSIEVLHAEWSYVTRPEALQEKVLRHLDLAPTSAQQVVRFADLPWRQDRLNLEAVPPVAEKPAPARPKPKQPQRRDDAIGALLANFSGRN